MKQKTVGIILALSTALISGVSGFVAKVSVTAVKDPILFTTLKNAIVAFLLIAGLTLFRKWKTLKTFSRANWLRLIAVGVIGGSIPFALFFTGLSLTSAVAGSFIHKTLFIWVLFLAIPFLKERLQPLQWTAMLLMLFGTFAFGGFQKLTFGIGDAMVFAATLFWAVENIIAKKALKEIPSSIVAAARMGFGSVILIGYVLVTGKAQLAFALSSSQWMWVIIPSILLFGYVTTWYAALKRLPATTTATLLVPATIITTLLSAGFGKALLQPSHILTTAVFSIACVCAVIPLLRQWQKQYA